METYEVYTVNYSKIIQANSIMEAEIQFSRLCQYKDDAIAIINVKYNAEFLQNTKTELPNNCNIPVVIGGFNIQLFPNPAMEKGKAVLMVHPEDMPEK